MYPLLASVGPVGFRTAGVVAIVAVWLAAALSGKEMAYRGHPPGVVHDFVTPALIAGGIGARLAYVLLFDPAWYLAHPWQVLAVWRGGFAEEGAFVAGLGAAVWWSRRRSVPLWRFEDALAPGVALGAAIGHLAAFLDGAGYGTPTRLPWAVTLTDAYSSAPLGIPLHPTQLYEFGLDLVLAGALWGWRGSSAPAGRRFLLFLLGSAIIRLVVDPVKADVIPIAEAVTSGQVAAAITLVAAALLLSRRGRSHAVSERQQRA